MDKILDKINFLRQQLFEKSADLSFLIYKMDLEYPVPWFAFRIRRKHIVVIFGVDV